MKPTRNVTRENEDLRFQSDFVKKKKKNPEKSPTTIFKNCHLSRFTLKNFRINDLFNFVHSCSQKRQNKNKSRKKKYRADRKSIQLKCNSSKKKNFKIERREREKERLYWCSFSFTQSTENNLSQCAKYSSSSANTRRIYSYLFINFLTRRFL